MAERWQTRAAKTNGMLRVGDKRDIKVFDGEVEKESVMKLKPIYEALHEFLMEEGYAHPQSGDDIFEDLYWERHVPQGFKEQHIWWRATKDINKMIRYFVQLDYQTILVEPAEVAYKGKKKKLEKVDLIIRIKCYVQFDPEDILNKSMWGSFKRMFFNKLYHQEVLYHQGEMKEFAMRLQRLCKGFMEMQTDKEHPRIFHKPLGYKDYD